jgi:uncharacterized protein (TIGR02677 family)
VLSGPPEIVSAMRPTGDTEQWSLAADLPAASQEMPAADSGAGTALRLTHASADDQLSAFTYVTVAQSEDYRLVMGLFAEHKRRFGLRLSPRELHSLWEDRHGGAPAVERVIVLLDRLSEWHALDRHPDTARASSTEEFKRARNTYDITAAGELVQAGVEQVLRLGEQTATLGQHRLRRIVELVEDLALLSVDASDGQRAGAALVSLRAEIAETVQGISAFMRDLGRVMTLGERLEREPFLAYKARVMEHLQRFDPALRQAHGRIVLAVAAVDERLEDVITAIASSERVVAAYGDSDARAAALRRAELTDQWRQAADWLAGRSDAAPWQQLRRTIDGALDWLLDTWSRMATEAAGRLDRSADYRRLAELLVEHPDAGPELFHLGVGLTPCRHVGGVDDDPEKAPDAHRSSWWSALALVLDRTLRVPSARAGQGGAHAVRNTREERALAAMQSAAEARAADALRDYLLAFDGRRLSDLGDVDDAALRAIEDWLTECGSLASGPKDRGPWRMIDAERELSVAVTAIDGTAVIASADGRWRLPDARLEVSRP